MLTGDELHVTDAQWYVRCTLFSTRKKLHDNMNISPKFNVLYRIHYITLSFSCQRITGTKGAVFIPFAPKNPILKQKTHLHEPIRSQSVSFHLRQLRQLILIFFFLFGCLLYTSIIPAADGYLTGIIAITVYRNNTKSAVICAIQRTLVSSHNRRFIKKAA